MGEEHYPRFSPREFARRHAAARSMMAQESIDVLVAYGNSGISRHNHADIHYLSGFLGNRNTYRVLPAQGEPVLFVQSYNHVPNAREVSAIETRWGGTDSAASVARHASEVRGRAATLGYVGEVPVQDYLTWQRALPNWRFILRDTLTLEDGEAHGRSPMLDIPLTQPSPPRRGRGSKVRG